MSILSDLQSADADSLAQSAVADRLAAHIMCEGFHVNGNWTWAFWLKIMRVACWKIFLVVGVGF